MPPEGVPAVVCLDNPRDNTRGKALSRGAASPPVNALARVQRMRVAVTASTQRSSSRNTEACGLSRLKNHFALLVRFEEAHRKMEIHKYLC